eukprot:gene28981-34975_t
MSQGHPSHAWSAFNPVTGAELARPQCTRCGAEKGSAAGIAECELQPAAAAAVVASLREEKSKKDSIVAISSATQSYVQSVFKQVGLTTVVEEAPEADSEAHFEKFYWGGRNEEDGLPDACSHIERQLKKFGVTIGRGGYKVVDVHTNKHLLDVSDDKIGEITGGTDVVVIPNKTANSSISRTACVLWELKTDENAAKHSNSLMHFESQGCLELLAARCLSDQPGVLVVLTDLVSGAVLLSMVYRELYGSFDVVEYQATLDQMGCMVACFLSDTAVPDASFRPIDEQNPRDLAVIAFKKTKLEELGAGPSESKIGMIVQSFRKNNINEPDEVVLGRIALSD